MKIWFSLFLLSSLRSYSQTDIFRNREFNLDNGVAISGYDPVSYYTLNKAVKGKKDFSYSYRGIIYRFATITGEQAFQANPAKYEPQYGGWCAYAMGHNGSKVEVDPETFKIINGKLFLFYNRFFNNTLKSWNQDELNLHTRADVNWQKIVQQ
jgi:YHS domain-containing protein